MIAVDGNFDILLDFCHHCYKDVINNLHSGTCYRSIKNSYTGCNSIKKNTKRSLFCVPSYMRNNFIRLSALSLNIILCKGGKEYKGVSSVILLDFIVYPSPSYDLAEHLQPKPNWDYK